MLKIIGITALLVIGLFSLTISIDVIMGIPYMESLKHVVNPFHVMDFEEIIILIGLIILFMIQSVISIIKTQ